MDPVAKFGLLSRSVTNCSGCGYGSGRSSTPFTTLKSAVFAPIPSASTVTAAKLNPGFCRSTRSPWRISMPRSSSQIQRHTSRLRSSVDATFPNWRRAAAVASAIGIPPSTISSDLNIHAQVLEPDPAPHFAAPFFGRRHISELAARRGRGLGHRHPAFHHFVDLLLQVRLNFVLDFVVRPPPRK